MSRSALRPAVISSFLAATSSLVAPSQSMAGPDACSTVANVATCTGNQSAGIASGVDFAVPAVTTLNVNTLTQNIAPGAGVDGISFVSAGSVTVTSTTGAFAISVQGAGADGIVANGTDITVSHTGSIASALGSGVPR
jgi:hypothetical protein